MGMAKELYDLKRKRENGREKVQGIRSIISRHKIDRGRLRLV